MPSLDIAKRDLSALLELLGLQGPGSHGPCRFCGDRTAMSAGSTDGIALFNCHRCGVSGSIVDALARAEGISSTEAIKRLVGRTYTPTKTSCQRTDAKPRKESIPPVPDEGQLRLVLDVAQRALNDCADLQLRWLAKRGIGIETARRIGLGFVVRMNVPNRKCTICNSWAIPITDVAGNVRAIKMHRENVKRGQKCYWFPLGIEPKEKPRHGWATFWPPPESYWPADAINERAAIIEFDAGLSRAEAEHRARLDVGRALPWLYLLPGELKAIAVIGAGLHATSITCGESRKWTPEMAARLAGRRVCIVFDDDAAGLKFRDNSLAALQFVAVELIAVTHGKNERGRKRDSNDVAFELGPQGLAEELQRLMSEAIPIATDAVSSNSINSVQNHSEHHSIQNDSPNSVQNDPRHSVQNATPYSVQKSPLMIETVSDAVAAALPTQKTQLDDKQLSACLFKLRRAVMGLPASRDGTFTIKAESEAVTQWHDRAASWLRVNHDRDLCWNKYLEAKQTARFSLYADPVLEAFETAKSMAPPKCACELWEKQEYRLIAALCRELQRLQGNNPFFVSCYQLQELMGDPHHSTAAYRLRLMQTAGIIRKVEEPQANRSTRYRYLHSLEE